MKRKRFNISFSFILIMIALSSCNKINDPGNFNLQQITYLKNNTETISESSKNFELGDLYASKEFYFILSNAGEYPITNIQIVSDNEQFLISPSNIDTLYPSDNSLNQPITIGILHGRVLNGIGTAPILLLGENNSTVTITGTTFDGRDNIEISFEALLSVNAKIADLSVITSYSEIDMTSYCHSSLGVEIGHYTFCINPTEYVTFENTGNVNLDIELEYNDTIAYEYETLEFSLQSGENYKINKSNISRLHVIFEGENAVTNPDKFITTDNQGKNYFSIDVNY